MDEKSNKKNKKIEIVDQLLTILTLPLLIIATGMKASEDLSLYMTGGKYSGKGSLGKSGRAGYWEPPDLLKPTRYSKDNLKKAILRAEKNQLIKREIGKSGRVQITITDLGKNKIINKYPMMKLAKRRWKGWWLVVSFDIPEEQKEIRHSIRHQLKKLGFAKWQLSVYVSPHDIADELHKVIKKNKLEEFVVPMIAKRIYSGTDWDLAKRLYNIEDLKQSYYQIAKSLRIPNAAEREHYNHFKLQLKSYTKLIKKDPFLPKGLGPEYGREKAYKALVYFAKFLKSGDKEI